MGIAGAKPCFAHSLTVWLVHATSVAPIPEGAKMKNAMKQAARYGRQVAELEERGDAEGRAKVRAAYRAFLAQFKLQSKDWRLVHIAYWRSYEQA